MEKIGGMGDFLYLAILSRGTKLSSDSLHRLTFSREPEVCRVFVV